MVIAIALAIAGGEERALYQGRQLLLHVSRANGARAQHTALPSRTVRSAVPAPPWSAAAAVAPHEHIKGEQRCCTDAQVDCARAPGHTHAIGHASAWQASPQEYCTAYGLQQRINIIVIIILASISPSSKTHQRRAGQLPRRMRHVTSYAHQ